MGTTKYAPRLTGEARERFAKKVEKRYTKGENIRSIAEDTGRSYGIIHTLLKEQGVKMRGRGGDRRSPKAKAK